MPTPITPDLLPRLRTVVKTRRGTRSQTAIADAAGMSRSQYAQVEGGITAEPSVQTWQRIAAALGWPLSRLVREAERSNPA